jgi:hypothetical protein
MDIYNKVIETEITHLTAEQLKNTEFINRIYTSVGSVNSKLCKLYYYSSGNSEGNEIVVKNDLMNEINNDSDSDKTNLFLKKIVYIKIFCDIVVLKKTSNSADNDGVDYYKDYIKMIEYFTKKIRKINNLPDAFDLHLVRKSFSEQFEEKMKSYNISKFINWIFL